MGSLLPSAPTAQAIVGTVSVREKDVPNVHRVRHDFALLMEVAGVVLSRDAIKAPETSISAQLMEVGSAAKRESVISPSGT